MAGICGFSIEYSWNEKAPARMRKPQAMRYFIVGDRSLLDSLPARPLINQDRANQDQVREWNGQSVAPMAGKPPIAGDHRRRARRDFPALRAARGRRLSLGHALRRDDASEPTAQICCAMIR